jgi:DNA-directed RNA polymerase subunit beta
MTPEEKLLRAIFGEKAADVKDTSLRLPPGTQGTIVEVRVFNRRGIDKDSRALMAIERAEIERLAKDRDDERRILEERLLFPPERIARWSRSCERTERVPSFKKGVIKICRRKISKMSNAACGARSLSTTRRPLWPKSKRLVKPFDEAVDNVKARFEDKVEKLQRGDELPPGVMKMVKVFVAIKRKMQPGDKMAGRHGNKGVVSRIMPA